MTYLGPDLPLGSLQKPVKATKDPKSLPRPSKPIKPRGKVANEWTRTRALWLKNNPANYQGKWQCTDCSQWFEHITLDHTKRRGSNPDKRTDLSLLEPVCAVCHVKRDSGMKYN